MRRLLILLLLTALYGTESIAQQEPQFSQNMFNKLSHNPAFAGTRSAISATAIHRQQWMGFGDGKPVTTNLSVDAGLPLGFGAGLNILNENIAQEDNLELDFIFSYKISLGRGQISSGLSLGIHQAKLDGTRFIAASPGDPAIPSGTSQGSVFNLGGGFYYNSEDAYIGLSVSNLTEPTIETEDFTKKLVRHYFLTSGYYFELSNILSLNPSFFLKSDGVTSQMDINTNLIFNDRIWGGISYRFGESIVVLSGMNITRDLKFGLSFDAVTNSISANSLEFMLGYSFNINYDKPVSKYKNPRFL